LIRRKLRDFAERTQITRLEIIMMSPTLRRTFDNPFQALRDFDRVVNRMWDQVEDGAGSAGFAVDVREADDQLVVEADLPGFTKDQINVNVEQGVLTIEAEREAADHGDGKVHLHERRSTRVTRRFTLPSTYDTQGIDATLSDGVLTLKLDKREESKPRKVEVK
jgi:HSP20 family protein